MKSWSDMQVVDLFNQVENFRKQHLTMREAFANYAKLYKRKPNSVRNYYYFELENLKKDEKRCKKLNIELKNHQKTKFSQFDKQEEEMLMAGVEGLIKNGMSVRSACLKLAEGDLSQMTRLQNKYQNLKRKNRPENIIKFEQPKKSLTEQDITSLFMGLVKLIKKTAQEELVAAEQEKEAQSQHLLKKAFLTLSKKERELAEVKKQCETLRLENFHLKNNKQQIFKERIEKVMEKGFKKRNILE